MANSELNKDQRAAGVNPNIGHRGEQVRSGKIAKKLDIKLGLVDIDSVIIDYFENAIMPEITDSTGQRVQVPIMYGNPERWSSIQKSRVYRDNKGKIQLPLIMFKRTGIEKQRGLGNKMDANSPKLYQGFENNFNVANQYDNFHTLQGFKKKKTYKRVVVPDYVDLSYDFVVTTEFIEQMNSIIEAVNYAEGSYWGQKERYNFKSKIDSFENATEIESGADRVITSNFSLTLSGFLIPDILQKKIASEAEDAISHTTIQISETITPTGLDVSASETVNVESGNSNNGYHPIGQKIKKII
tara:strand:- start:3230 stop:4126 length:897 start_codon:yes stop_codon:yes gene_type:complete